VTESELPTRRLGRRVLLYETIDSTNSRALQLADRSENDGLAILADEQGAGRGQHGRKWLAPPRSSVLLSVLLFPPPPLARPSILTAWAAASVCVLVRRLSGRPPRIKWPNDVLLDGRKVCGILIEQSRLTHGTATVAGIGLNVQQRPADFAAAGLPEATSLTAAGVEGLDTRAVAFQLLHVLDEQYDRMCKGELAELEGLWREHLGLLGQDVLVEAIDGVHVGRLVELGFEGVVLADAAGDLHVLAPEVVLHIRQR